MSSNQLSGIDVSKWQATVNWESVQQAGIEFAFARATYGTSEVDSYFSDNWQAMKNAGVIRGAYHFFLVADDPTQQAEFFIKTVGSLGPNDLPPVIDVESTSGTSSNLAADVQTWLNVVEQGLGRTPIIYTAPSYWNENITGGFGDYPLWVAEYGVSSPKPVNGWSNYTFWQYSSSGTVAGVNGAVDQDYFNGTSQDLTALINASIIVTASA
jgi:lysozyme